MPEACAASFWSGAAAGALVALSALATFAALLGLAIAATCSMLRDEHDDFPSYRLDLPAPASNENKLP